MRPAAFEPTISAGERPQTYALDRAVTGTGLTINITNLNYRQTGLAYSSSFSNKKWNAFRKKNSDYSMAVNILNWNTVWLCTSYKPRWCVRTFTLLIVIELTLRIAWDTAQWFPLCSVIQKRVAKLVLLRSKILTKAQWWRLFCFILRH